MRIVFISDTHNINYMRQQALNVPDGDVLVHCGDATVRGDMEEIGLFANWFSAFPHKHKIFVPGNHDWGFQYAHERKELGSLDWCVCLIDSGVMIDGVSFWGSPWQPEFCNWAFNVPRGPELKAHWDLIPADTDVLITHSPPKSVLDGVWRSEYRYSRAEKKQTLRRFKEHVGCADLFQAVKRVNPKVHAFGHIHSSYGMRSGVHGLRTRFINCAMADEGYFFSDAQPPVVIDL